MNDYWDGIRKKEKYEKDHKKKNSDSRYEPRRVTEYQVPEYKEKNGYPKCVREFYSKVYTFIDHYEHLRFNDCCTADLPIPVTSKFMSDLFVHPYEASRFLINLQEIGLIRICNSDYEWRKSKEENYCRTYYYYIENERKILEYIRDNNIEMMPLRNAIEVQAPKTFDFDPSTVIFSSNLHIPYNKSYGSKRQFELDLIQILYQNHPWLHHYQELADTSNDIDYTPPEFRSKKGTNYEKKHNPLSPFKSRFKVNFTWNEKGDAIIKIGIRDTNSYANAEKEKDGVMPESKNNRPELIKRHGLNLHYDVCSSIHRVAKSIYNLSWISEDIDLYQEMKEEFLLLKEREGGGRGEPGGALVHNFECTEISREAIKGLANKLVCEAKGDSVAITDISYAILFVDEETDTYNYAPYKRLEPDIRLLL